MLIFEGTNRVTSIFGIRGKEFHDGIDVVGDNSKMVRAVVGGTVIQSRQVPKGKDKTWEWGNYVSIRDEKGNIHFYCHLDRRYAKVGDGVSAGTVLGVMGNTGFSKGPHTHYQTRDSQGNSINPTQFLGIPNKLGNYTDTQTKHETGDDDMKMGIYAPTDKTVSSQLLKEGAFAIMQEGRLKLYERRMVREINDGSLSPQFEAMKSEMQNNELIVVTEN